MSTCDPKLGKKKLVENSEPNEFRHAAMSKEPSSRRSFLRGTSAASLGGLLSSCGSSLTPFTVTGPILRTSGREQIVVDAHCHVFNGRDVDIAAYASALVEDKLTPALAVLFSGYVKIFASVLRASAPPGRADEFHTKGELELLRHLNEKVASGGLRRDSLRYRNRMEEFLPAIFKVNDINNREAVKTAMRWMLNPVNLTRKPRALVARIEKALHENKDTEAADNYLRSKPAPGELASALDRLLVEGPQFFVHFTNYRTLNAYEMWRQFNPRDGQKNIDLFTPATIDYDTWFNPENTPLSPNGQALCIEADTQTNRELMEQLAILFNGEIMPLMGFCPRRAAECRPLPGTDNSYRCERPHPLDVVRDAIEHGGHLGVKIYPPMGFRASANSEIHEFGNLCRHSAYMKFLPQGLGPAMDHELDRLYAYCDAASVPIVAHAVESHGSHGGYAARSSPEHWLPLFDEELAQRSGLSHAHPNLRLSFAHLGGWHPAPRTVFGRLLDKRSHRVWPEQIIELVRTKPHVFTDIGDIAEIGQRGWADAFTAALHKWEADTPQSAAHRPCQKIMYGSDWFVLANADIFRQKRKSAVLPEKLVGPSYLQRWATHLSQSFPESYRDIMGHNALRFYGLDQASNLHRVDGFLDRNALSPGWRKKLKAALRDV